MSFDYMESFSSMGRVYRATWPGCLRLFLVSSVVLSALGLILVPYRDEILDKVIGFFLPSDWLASFHMANDALFHQIGGVLLFQTVAIVCFSTVSLFFFPFRDRISSLAETQLTGEPANGPGLAQELWLEAGLVVIAFNLYSATYLLAYFVGQPLFGYIDELAFILLMLFFTLDLLSPTHFRRRLNCLYVFRAVRQQPIKLLVFATTFCFPIFALELFLGDLVYKQEDDFVLAVALVAIIVLNCFVCVFALPMGTWLALHSIQQFPGVGDDRQGRSWYRAFYGCQLVLLFVFLLFYGSVVRVVANKVPLKSAEYNIQWMTFDYEQGEAGELPRLRFDVRIFNRHESLGLEVENATLLLNLEGRYLGAVGLNIPYVAPGQDVSVPVDLKLSLSYSEMAGIAAEELVSVFTGEQAPWRDNIQARLMVQLPLGMQLPIYITQGYRHEFQEE
jgi:hypothetical protein